MNPYNILGVKRNATQDEIRKSYVKLLERYKPGEYPGDENFAKHQIKKIRDAYDLLSDKQAKYEYDIKNQEHISMHYSTSDLYSKYYPKKQKNSHIHKDKKIAQKKYNKFIDQSLNAQDEQYSNNFNSNTKIVWFSFVFIIIISIKLIIEFFSALL